MYAEWPLPSDSFDSIISSRLMLSESSLLVLPSWSQYVVSKSSCLLTSSRPWGFELLHASISMDNCRFTVDLLCVWIWDLRPSI